MGLKQQIETLLIAAKRNHKKASEQHSMPTVYFEGGQICALEVVLGLIDEGYQDDTVQNYDPRYIPIDGDDEIPF